MERETAKETGMARRRREDRPGVRLSVELEGSEILVYGFADPGEAARMTAFLRQFLPQARFMVSPLLN